MLSLRNQTVNVNRVALILALKQGKTQHKAQLLEATTDYRSAAVAFLEEAKERTDRGDFSDIHFKLSEPVSKVSQYDDVIAMLEVSVDDTIQLDSEAYRAYYKNEWPWTNSFLESVGAYKAFLGGRR